MKRLLVSVLALTCAAGELAAQGAPLMPAWIVPFPGASAQSKARDNAVESSYQAAALPKDVLAHFQKLFDDQGIPIDSIAAPEGFYLHAEAQECNLDISIVRAGGNTTVKVTCAAKSVNVQRVVTEPVQDKPEEAPGNPMKKFDKPVAPGAKTPVALSWPSWLVRVDGAKLAAQKVAGELKSSFTAEGPRRDLEAFYTDLLDTNNYTVTKTLPTTADEYGSSLLGSSEPEAKTGKRTVIRVRIKPEAENFHVEITMQ
jgi:hypothetical protein